MKLSAQEQAVLCDALTRQQQRWDTLRKLMRSEGKPTPPDAREALSALSGLLRKFKQPTG